MFVSDQGTKLLSQSLLLALATSAFGYFVAVEVDVLIFVFFFLVYSSSPANLEERNGLRFFMNL